MGFCLSGDEIRMCILRKKVVKMFIIVIILFCVCWLFFYVYLFIVFFVYDKIFCFDFFLSFYFIFLFLGYVNLVINLYLYVLFYWKYWEGFKVVWICFVIILDDMGFSRIYSCCWSLFNIMWLIRFNRLLMIDCWFSIVVISEKCCLSVVIIVEKCCYSMVIMLGIIRNVLLRK